MLNKLDFNLPTDEDLVEQEREEGSLGFALMPSMDSTEDDYKLDFALPDTTSVPPPHMTELEPYEEEEYLAPVSRDKVKMLTSLGEDYSVDNIANHHGLVQTMESYLTKRIGEDGIRKEGETEKDVVERFLTHMRFVEGNTIDTMQEVDFLKDEKTSQQTKDNFNILYTMYQEMPNFASEGGGGFWSGASDVLTAAVFDPATAVGLGFGGPIGSVVTQAVKQAGKGAATRAILATALKGNLGKITAMTSVEGLLGAMSESQRQEVKLEVGMMASKDWKAIGAAGALGGVGSLIGFPLGISAAKKGLASAGLRSGDQVLADRINAKVTRSGRNPETPEEIANFDPITGGTFDREGAERIRDALSMPNAPFNPQIQNDIIRVSTIAVGNLMKDMPQKYFQDEGEKISDTVMRILGKSDKIDEDVLERALTTTGLNMEEFSQLERLTTSDAGRTLQHYSALKQKIDAMAGNNPELKKKLREIYGEGDKTRSVFGTFTGFVKRLDRETRAMMVSQLSTTARNVISAGAFLTFGAASKAIESTIYHAARGVSSALGGNASIQGTKKGLLEIGEDAFSTLGQMVTPKQNKALADMLLKNNSRLSNTLFRTMQETGDQDLSRVTKWMNGLNMAQDQVIRSGVFTDSVNRQMKKLDLDMYDYIANHKPIPIEVLKKGTDDALEATFAKMPEAGLARKFVEFVESMPLVPVIGTHQFPFARFMADAMLFQYKYSPLNFLNAASVGIQGGAKTIKATRALASGTLDKEGKAMAESALVQGKKGVAESVERISKGTVGSAALYAAYLYRDENQNSAWYNMNDTNENNKPVDIRAVFPMAPYLAVADLLVKWKNGDLDSSEPAGQLMAGIAGSQWRPSRVQDFVGDLFETLVDADADTVTGEKIGAILGDWAGSVAGRPFTAAQIGRDIYSAFDDTEAIVRETRMVKGEGMQEVMTNSFLNHLKSKVPVWQRDLPEYRSPTTGGTVRRQSAAMAQFSGIKYLPALSEVETELARQGIESYTIVPKTGNKQADYYAKKSMPPYVNMLLSSTIVSPWYKSQPKFKQRLIITGQINEAKKIAKMVGEGEASLDAMRNGEGYTTYDKGKWAKTPKESRKLANEYFMNNYGKTVEEMGAFAAGAKIGRALAGVYK